MKAACLCRPLTDGNVQCRACSHFCRIKPGRRGICGVRENRDGTLVSLVYDRVVAAGIDPIEKKPIFHLRPGSTSFSIATMGCNLTCRFCQNADIAHPGETGAIAGRRLRPEEIVDQAIGGGCESISFTYTEPSVFIELALDTARLAKKRGLYTVFVTNGFMSPDLIEMTAPVLDAANVDLKAFDDRFYKDYCGARLAPVKENLKLLKSKGVLVEVTTLVIPGLNDDPLKLQAMAEFIARELGPETPWHLSRFHPAYRLTDRGPTPVSTLDQACAIGERAGLFYVYTGNVPGGRESTRCHACGALAVERRGYGIKNLLLEKGACPQCQTPVYGIY